MFSMKYPGPIQSPRSMINISSNLFTKLLTINKIRLIVKHVRKSSLLSQQFVYDNLKNVKKLTLILDVSTR